MTKQTPHLDPKMWKIGLSEETAAIVRAHPQGTQHSILEHAHWQGGNVLLVDEEEYNRISTFCGKGETIEQAVRKAFCQ